MHHDASKKIRAGAWKEGKKDGNKKEGRKEGALPPSPLKPLQTSVNNSSQHRSMNGLIITNYQNATQLDA